MRNVARLIVLSVLLIGLPLAAATFNVDITLDVVDAAPGDGVCATPPSFGPSGTGTACTLRAAIMEANALAGGPHTINVPAGLYILSIPGVGEDAAATGDLDLTASMSIIGAGAATTVIGGAQLDRVFEIGSSATVQISGLTIRDGWAVAAGTGPSGSANFVGGAIYNRGTLTLADCAIAGNRANAGGGIWSSGTLTIHRCTIRRNLAVDIGKTNSEGGGLLVSGPSTTITNTTISDNWAVNGGGIHVQNELLALTNVTLSANIATGAGALDSTNGIPTLTHVTIANNDGSPGGVQHYSFDGARSLTLGNSLFADNSGGNCDATAGPTVSLGGNVDSGTTCALGAGDRTNAHTRIGPLQSNGGETLTHALLSGSDAINAATPAGCAATDQRGVARPKGGGCDSGAFERDSSETFTAVRTMPILLDVVGGTGAHFTSELLIANRGTTTANLQLTYTAATALGASGSGTVADTLGPGQQLGKDDALAYLRNKGLPIPTSGNRGGTLRIVFSGLSSADAGFAVARTAAVSGAGRAGLAYAAVRAEDLATFRVRLFGLRDSTADRTNLALVNAGTGGAIGLKVTLTSGIAGDASTFTLSTVVLQPGQWTQINAGQLLRAAGMTNAWALVEEISGTDPYIAYAVFNDNKTDDGSYVHMGNAGRVAPDQVLPVLVESDSFESELVLANPTNQPMQAALTFDLSLGTYSGANRTETESLAPHEQRIIPSAIEYLRTKGVAVDARGPGKTFAGILRVKFTPSGGAPAEGFVGARTASSAPSGGQYGLFYSGLGTLESAVGEAWVYALTQDSSNRSNLAVLNTGSEPITLHIDVFDALTGALAGGQDVVLGPGGWKQINGILATYGLQYGYARVTRTSGTKRFIVYGVINDGATSTSGATNDGSYVAGSVVR